MTPRDLIRCLYENVTFPPATASKRFVHQTAERPEGYEISERAEAFAWRIAYRFRRQLPKDVAEEAVRRKVDHKWDNIGGPKFLLRCSVCGDQAWYSTARNINAPCPGPPSPPKTKKTRSKKERSGTRGAVAAESTGKPVESPNVAPLFEGETN